MHFLYQLRIEGINNGWKASNAQGHSVDYYQTLSAADLSVGHDVMAILPADLTWRSWRAPTKCVRREINEEVSDALAAHNAQPFFLIHDVILILRFRYKCAHVSLSFSTVVKTGDGCWMCHVHAHYLQPSVAAFVVTLRTLCVRRPRRTRRVTEMSLRIKECWFLL